MHKLGKVLLPSRYTLHDYTLLLYYAIIELTEYMHSVRSSSPYLVPI